MPAWKPCSGRSRLGTDEFPWYARTNVISPEKFGDWSEVMKTASKKLAAVVAGGASDFVT